MLSSFCTVNFAERLKDLVIAQCAVIASLMALHA